MKNKLEKKIVLGILEFIILGTFSVLAQPNLILNSNIEDGSTVPTNWNSYVSSGTMSCAWRATMSGEHSLKIEATTDGMGQWSQKIMNPNNSSEVYTVDDSVVYRFRAHLYANNINVGASAVELHWYDANNVYLGRTQLSATISSTWQEVKNNMVIPQPNSVKVYVVFRAYKAGIYYLDDPVLMRKDTNLHTINDHFPVGLYAMPSDELLVNGDAENHISTNTQIPRTWAEGNIRAIHTWDNTFKYAGNRSLGLTLAADGADDWRQLVLNISDSDQFHLKAMIYANNITNGSHSVELQWFDATSNYLGRNSYSANIVGSWVTIDQHGITPPAGAVKVYFLLRAYKVGQYNFDNLSLSIDQTNTDKLQAIKNTGFNLLMSFDQLDTMDAVPGLYGVVNVNTTNPTLATVLNNYDNKNALKIWHASPDEPAWWVPPTSVEAMTNGYNIILSTDEYYSSRQHKVWINHAPRGTQSSPLDFGLLRPYSQAADIISMDIYPVGAAYHSNLANKTLSCVGDYVKILYDFACTDSSGLQDKPIWMVLQGASHTDLGRVTHSAELHWLDANGTVKRIDKFYLNSTGSWQNINGQGLIPPVDTVKVSIQLRSYAPGTYAYDNVSLIENGTEKIINGNFETENGSTNYPASWNISMRDGTISEWDSSDYTSATHSVKTIVSINTIASWYQTVEDIDHNKIYDFSISIKSSIPGEYAAPTWIQTRFMVYDAIINGARGIIYYGCTKIARNSQLWNNIKNIAEELNTLSNALISLQSFRKVTSSSSAIELLLLDTPTGLLLISANKTAQSVSVAVINISGLSLSQRTKYNSSTPEMISNNSFSESFTPYEVKIWNIE